MKILAIGNSFSQDATYYLHAIASLEHKETKVVNLCIGGCSLEQHWQNIIHEKKEYLYELNGKSCDRFISIQDAIKEEKWDIIVTQQVSHDSGWSDSYEPFLSMICAWLRKEQPQARLCLQKTWAYEINSEHFGFWRYNRNQDEMYSRLCSAYEKAAEKNKLFCIPSADIIQALRNVPEFDYSNNGKSLCRDGFHMHYIYGRYAVAATWYAALYQKKISGNSYIPNSELLPDYKVDENLIFLIQKVVDKVLGL